MDEEVFLEWGKKPSKKYVLKETSTAIQEKAERFIRWLKEADEESSETEDEDFEVGRRFLKDNSRSESFQGERNC